MRSLWRTSMKKASLLIGLALAFSGCAPGYVTDSNASVMLLINSFSPSIVDSDVATDEGTILPDLVTMNASVRAKNQNVTVPQVAMSVDLERYEVRYFRSDGRNQEGVDVPYRISGPLAVPINALTSGGTDFSVEIVRRQAKIDPPLRNLVGGGGALVVTVFAEVTIHGRTVSGQAVSDTARVQIDFADIAG